MNTTIKNNFMKVIALPIVVFYTFLYLYFKHKSGYSQFDPEEEDIP